MEKAKYLHKIFLAQKIELRIVGGFVRDMLLGKKADDIDLVAGCLPDIIIDILQKNNIKYRSTHIDHGVVIAIIDGKSFEISSLRQDIECYGRKAKVAFVTDFTIDAQRRDFTINALYLDFSGKIYDFFSSQDDLKNHLVQFIGNPQQRIKEDYLRILRFFRFTGYYGKSLNQSAINSIKNLQHHLQEISIERINQEFFKILLCPRKIWLLKILQNMEQCQIFQTLLGIKKINLLYLKNIFISQKILRHNFLYQEISYLLALIFDQKKQKILNIFDNLRISKKQQKYLRNLLLFIENSPKNLSLKNITKLAINLELEDKKLIADFLLFINLRKIKNHEIKSIFAELDNFKFPKIKITDTDKNNLQYQQIGQEIKKRKIQQIL